MASRKTIYVDSDVLVIGGGFGGCGAAYESRYWGRDKKVVVVEKANIERSGAVAQGLYAINCYMGMQWDENKLVFIPLHSHVTIDCIQTLCDSATSFNICFFNNNNFFVSAPIS